MPLLASDLINEAADLLQENFGASAIWTRAEILKYVDAGLREYAVLTQGLRELQGFEMGNSQAIYSLSEIAIQIDFAQAAGSEIFPEELRALELKSTSWPSNAGTPQAYFQESLGLQRIGVYPQPVKAQTNVISVASGNWLSAATWSVGRAPQLYDVVTVDVPHTVALNGNAACGYSSAADAVIVNGVLNSAVGTTFNMMLLGSLNTSGGSFSPAGVVNVLNYGGGYSAVAGDLSLLAKVVPVTITLETDVIPVNPLCEPLLRDYIVWQALDREGDGQDWERGEHYRERFESICNLLRKSL